MRTMSLNKNCVLKVTGRFLPTLKLLNGKWVDGPKDEFFEVLIKTFGEEPPIIAEDLGIITDDVRALRDKFGLPGMKILQFAFEDEDSNYLPYNQPYNCVCYTGTHDNDTTTGEPKQVRMKSQLTCEASVFM